MADPTPLNRNQIAAFVGNDPEAIRAIERLFKVAGQLTPAEIARLTQLILDNSYATGAADNKAEVAIAEALAAARLVLDAAYAASAADNKAEVALAGATAAERLADLIGKGPLSDAHNSVTTDYVDLNINAPVPADKPGRAYWNRDDGTMDVDLYGGSVLQVGQEIHFYAKNTSGSLIANGTPVMFTGTVGASGKLTFGLAVADGSVPADYMMGVATQDIPDNDFGYVTSFGLVRGFNTTGTPYGEVWADGDLLYFDPATPGTWTNVQPSAPNIGVPVAVVVNTGPGGSGSIFVRMKISESLNNLQDVYINGTGTPLAGEVLIYDAAQARWENHHITPGANISITNGNGSISIAVSGLGSMAFQNSNSVSITGGTIDGTTIGGSSAAAGTFTTVTASGDVTIADKIVHSGDTNTAIRFPAADTVTVETSGAERMRITNTGNVGIGTVSPGTLLHLYGSATAGADTVLRVQNGNTDGAGYLGFGDTDDNFIGGIQYDHVNDSMGLFVNNSYRMTIDSSGRILIGDTEARATVNSTGTSAVTPTLQKTGTSENTSSIGLFNYSTNISSDPTIAFSKSLNATIGSHTAVTSGTQLGGIGWNGSDGTAFAGAAYILSNVDGTVASGSVPGRLTFATTSVGGTSAAERMRITASGNVGIGNTAPVVPLHVTGATMTTGVIYCNQPAQTSKAAAATLTIAELLTGIIQYTGTAATLTLPTGTNIEGGLPATFPTNMSFDVSVINTGSGTVTIGANGNTTVGGLTVAAGASGLFRVRKTGTNAYTIYCIS